MMRMFVSNLYGMISNKIIADKQHRIADMAKRMGYIECGIYNYPAENEPQNELKSRAAGIIAAVKQDDIVVLQLPTGNGERFENCLINAIRERKAHIALIWHSMKYYLEQKNSLAILSDYEVPVGIISEALDSQENYMLQKIMIDIYQNIHKNQDMDENVIHIGMGVHDKDGKYCSWLGVAMQSLVEHTNEKIDFHILHDDTLTTINRQRLEYIASRTNNKIDFHPIDKKYFDSQNEQMGIYTIGALFRILLPEICLNLPRIIYLDSDILVNIDIKELWNIDIEDYYMAAVPDIDIVEGRIWSVPVTKGQMQKESYFNSGVIYMNLDKIRQLGNMKDAVLEYIKENPGTNLPDQDALNVIYQSKILLLEQKWNRFAKHVCRCGERELKDCIYHYVGTRCALYYKTAMNILYIQTANRTPWGFKLSGNYISRAINRQLYRIDNLRDSITQICSEDKKILFYGQETYAMKNMYRLLGVNDKKSYRVMEHKEDEGILQCRTLDDLQNEVRGKYIVYVLPDADEGRAMSNLEKLGLQNRKDFFVIPCFLLEENGGYLL